MLDLTPAQRRVLRIISDYTARHGYPPSNRDICTIAEWASTNAAAEHVRKLRKKGALTVSALKARSMVLTDEGREALEGNA